MPDARSAVQSEPSRRQARLARRAAEEAQAAAALAAQPAPEPPCSTLSRVFRWSVLGLVFLTLVSAAFFAPGFAGRARHRMSVTALNPGARTPGQSNTPDAPAEAPPAWTQPAKKIVPEMNSIVLDHYLKNFRAALDRNDQEAAKKYALTLAKTGPKTLARVAEDPYLASQFSRLTMDDTVSSKENRQ